MILDFVIFRAPLKTLAHLRGRLIFSSMRTGVIESPITVKMKGIISILIGLFK